jgi:hypothetical protein
MSPLDLDRGVSRSTGKQNTGRFGEHPWILTFEVPLDRGLRGTKRIPTEFNHLEENVGLKASAVRSLSDHGDELVGLFGGRCGERAGWVATNMPQRGVPDDLRMVGGDPQPVAGHRADQDRDRALDCMRDVVSVGQPLSNIEERPPHQLDALAGRPPWQTSGSELAADRASSDAQLQPAIAEPIKGGRFARQ